MGAASGGRPARSMLITPTWTADRNASRSLRVIESDIGMASETRGRKPDSRRLDRDRRPLGDYKVPPLRRPNGEKTSTRLRDQPSRSSASRSPVPLHQGVRWDASDAPAP